MVSMPPLADVADRSAERLPMMTLTVLAASLFAGITTEILPVGLLPVIARQLQVTRSAIGLLISAYAIVVAIGSVPLALFASRWPRRPTLCAILICYAISNLIFATTSTYWVALAARMLAGLAHAALLPTAFAIAVEATPPTKTAKAIAFANGGNLVALTLGVPIGTTLGTAIGWRWTFAGAAVLLLVLAAAVRFIIPGETSPRRSSEAISPAVLLRPALFLLASGTVVLTVGHYIVYTYISPVLLHAGVSTHGVGPVLFGYGAAGLLGLAVVSRFGEGSLRRVLAGIAIIAVCALITIAAAGADLVPTIAAVVAWGASFGALSPLLQTATLRVVPEDAGLAPALVNSTWNIGISGGAAIGGKLLGLSPFVSPLVAAGLITASLGLLLPGSRGQASRPGALASARSAERVT